MLLWFIFFRNGFVSQKLGSFPHFGDLRILPSSTWPNAKILEADGYPDLERQCVREIECFVCERACVRVREKERARCERHGDHIKRATEPLNN